MPEGHAQFCERHIAACIVMTTFRGYSCIVWMQEWPPWCCQVHTCNVRGFSLSSNQCHQGLSPRNIAPHRNPSGLTLILRLFFCSGIRLIFTLCCAFRRILSACNRCIFLTKKAAEFHSCGLVRRKLPLRQPDAHMTRYFRLFSQFTIILARMPAMTGAAKSCQKAMPSSASVI